MMRIGMLLPEAGMMKTARKLMEDNKMDLAYLKAIHTVDTVNEARLAVEAGSDILIARGYQAMLIKEYTNIPLVEMHLHTQEIGLLIKKAKQMVRKEQPTIGLIAFDNMLRDLTHMEELFEVRLLVANLCRIEDVAQILAAMSEQEVDIIIGGEITCGAAEQMGYPTVFYQSTEESLTEAYQIAKSMAFAVEREKQNTAQFETLLDTSFNGIIKVNTDGKIIVINKMAEKLLGKKKEAVIGLPIKKIIPQIDTHFVNQILEGKKESCSTSISIQDKAWMLLAAPIQYDGFITGAILSLHKIANMESKTAGGEMLLHGFSVRTNFQHIYTENKAMKRVLEQAKAYALSESPVLIYGLAGTEDDLLAEAIHNNSNRKAGPYVSINIRGIDREKQMEELFYRRAIEESVENAMKGAMIKANYGTLFLKGIEHLTLKVQHQILRTMRSKAMLRTDAQPIDALDVRIIGCAKTNLRHLVQKKRFSEELYYMLHGLTLTIPSLNQRPEDLLYCFDKEIRKFEDIYHRTLKITEGGYKKITSLPWNGNLIQVKAFCERLVLTAEKRTIDEGIIQKLHEELYPAVEQVGDTQRIVVYKSQESVELGKLLKKHQGNRGMVAKELGISTTTLWRRMKKYGLEAKFDQD